MQPYTYAFSTGATTQDISGLSAGTFTLTVTDGNGCSGEESFRVMGGEPFLTIGSCEIKTPTCYIIIPNNLSIAQAYPSINPSSHIDLSYT